MDESSQTLYVGLDVHKESSTYPVGSAWPDILWWRCQENRGLPRPDFPNTLVEVEGALFLCQFSRCLDSPVRMAPRPTMDAWC